MNGTFVFKAQADAEILKSVVLPLEEEIKGLRSKLAAFEVMIIEKQILNDWW